MDMKKFLQAVDGASSSKKSAEGSGDMKRFLRVVKEADLNQTPSEPTPAPDQFDAVTLDSADGFKDAVKKAATASGLEAEELAQVDKMIIADADGTVDVEKTLTNMLTMFSDAMPEMVKMVQDLIAAFEKAMKAPEFATLDPEAKQSVVDALADMKAQLPVMQRNAQAAAAQIKTDAAPQTPVYERSIFGKYFKKVEQEITEHRQQTKDKAELLAEKVSKKIMKRISERVTIGPDGQVTGGFKPTPADPDAPVKPAATQEPPATIPGSNLQKAEKADKESGTITVGGQEYNMVMLPPGGIRPRSGKKIAIPQAVMGERGIGNYIGILTNGTVYVIPKGEQ